MTRENSRSQSIPRAAATTVQRDTARNSAICGCRPDASDVGGWAVSAQDYITVFDHIIDQIGWVILGLVFYWVFIR
jgi:hypothetical protein